MPCDLCGDESVTRGAAPSGNELALLVAEACRSEYMEHLRLRHPAEYAREHERETEMNAHLARIFGKG